MESIDFLVVQLKRLSKKFKNISIRYQFDQTFYNHIIEIRPENVYDHDQVYQAAESNIIGEFINHFPDETVVFIKEDDLIQVTDPILEIKSSVPNLEHDLSWLSFILQDSKKFSQASVKEECCNECDFALAA